MKDWTIIKKKKNLFTYIKTILKENLMSYKKKLVIGLSVLALMFALNMNYAINKYGIMNNSLSIHVLAQSSSSSGDGSGSDSGSSGGGSSSSTDPDDEGCKKKQDNVKCDKDGDPKDCTLKKYKDAEGNVKWVDSDSGTPDGFTYTGTSITGLKEECPNDGHGCTVYPCQSTPT